MPDIEIITYHGWGFDSNCWQAMQDSVPPQICWKNFDRGYFNYANAPEFTDGKTLKVIITHSFGLHQCDPGVFKKADVLVIMSGFLRFHPKAAQFRRRSKLVLNEMINQFEQYPENVLKTFYRNVFHPEKSFKLPQQEINKSLLLNDLKKLDKSEMLLPELKKTARVCIFQGTDDAIVPKGKGRALYEQLGKQAQYFEIKKAGHAIPITHASQCWEIVEPIIFNERSK